MPIDLVLGNWKGQITKVTVGEHFVSSDHSSINLKIVMGGQGRPTSYGLKEAKAKFDGIRQELLKLIGVDCLQAREHLENGILLKE